MNAPKLTKKPRLVYVTSNKYQTEIILLTFIPSVLTFLSFISFVVIANPAISKAIFHISFYDKEKLINDYSWLMIFFMCLFFVIALYCSFIVSHHMVGAFGRIIRELDEIIAGRSQKAISCRPKDTLTKDLLKRVNVLIEHYVKDRK